MTEVHVIADDRTTWRVYDAGSADPVSEHTNATDAEHVARARAEDRGAQRVVVHDRYHRTHDAEASLALERARARRAQARRLGVVRDTFGRLARSDK